MLVFVELWRHSSATVVAAEVVPFVFFGGSLISVPPPFFSVLLCSSLKEIRTNFLKSFGPDFYMTPQFFRYSGKFRCLFISELRITSEFSNGSGSEIFFRFRIPDNSKVFLILLDLGFHSPKFQIRIQGMSFPDFIVRNFNWLPNSRSAFFTSGFQKFRHLFISGFQFSYLVPKF